MTSCRKPNDICSECDTCQDCNVSAPAGIYIIPGSGQLSEFPGSELLNCPDESTNIIQCITDGPLCPRAYPPTTVCVRECAEYAAVAGINFINGDLVIGEPAPAPVVGGLLRIVQPLALTTIDLLDVFPNLLGVNGSIYIVGTKYRRITGFERLRFVTGSIVIVNNINLISIPTFSNLISVGGLVTSDTPISDIPIARNSLAREADEDEHCGTSAIIIANNNALQSITGFESVRQIQNGIIIANNSCLTQICAFIHLYRTNRLVIKSNHRLQKIAGFGYLDTLNIGFYLLDNSVDGEQDLIIRAFSGLETIGDMAVIGNATLREFKLEALHTVYGTAAIRSNPTLETLTLGLHTVQNLYIERNKALLHVHLPCLREVNKELNIASNCAITCLDTFNELLRVGHGILIADNKQLYELKGFDKLKYIGARCVSRPDVLIPTTCGGCGCTTELVFDWNSITVIDCVVTDPFEINFFDSSINACSYTLSEDFFRLICNSETPCGQLVVGQTIPDVISFSLAIYHNQRLKAIGGFCNLRHLVSNLYIIDNAILHTIKSFGQLAYVLDIWIRNNRGLRYIIGFSNLLSIRDLVVYDAHCLIDFNGLKSLEFAQKIATEAKTANSIKIPRGAVPSVLGYTLYYSYEGKRC
jgi:hypothetical protein